MYAYICICIYLCCGMNEAYTYITHVCMYICMRIVFEAHANITYICMYICMLIYAFVYVYVVR